MKTFQKLYFLFLHIFVACYIAPYGEDANTQDNSKNPLIYSLNHNINFAKINEKNIEEAVAFVLREADLIVIEILVVPENNYTFNNTLLRLDDLYNLVSRVWSPLELMASVHPNDIIRDKASESCLIFQKYLVELYANEELYNIVHQFSTTKEAGNLPINRKRFLESELKEFRNSGLGLSMKDREKLKQDQNLISELILKFDLSL